MKFGLGASQGKLAVHACGANVHGRFLKCQPCGQPCGGVRCRAESVLSPGSILLRQKPYGGQEVRGPRL